MAVREPLDIMAFLGVPCHILSVGRRTNAPSQNPTD